MAETIFPPAAHSRIVGRNAVAQNQQARQPSAARMLRQVDQQVVFAAAQLLLQAPFRARLSGQAQAFPAVVDAEHLRDRRIATWHGSRIGVGPCVDLQMRRVVFQHRENG